MPGSGFRMPTSRGVDDDVEERARRRSAIASSWRHSGMLLVRSAVGMRAWRRAAASTILRARIAESGSARVAHEVPRVCRPRSSRPCSAQMRGAGRRTASNVALVRARRPTRVPCGVVKRSRRMRAPRLRASRPWRSPERLHRLDAAGQEDAAEVEDGGPRRAPGRCLLDQHGGALDVAGRPDTCPSSCRRQAFAACPAGGASYHTCRPPGGSHGLRSLRDRTRRPRRDRSGSPTPRARNAMGPRVLGRAARA